MRKALFFLAAVLVWSCHPRDEKKPNIGIGTINIGLDESVENLIDEQIVSYQQKYKEAKFNKFILPENQAIKLFLEDSMDVIGITRVLTEEEKFYLDENHKNYKPAPIALDAVTLIVNLGYGDTEISLEKLKQMFLDEKSTIKLVFDQGNSSNLNLVLTKLGITEFNRANVVAAGSEDKVVDWVKTNRNSIGFVGFSLLSEAKSEKVQERLKSVKILGLESEGKIIFPNKQTMVEQVYPFHRVIYLHTKGTAWGVENGFIRFASAKTGQLIAEKLGLVPWFAIPKEFYLTKEPLD